MTRILLLALSLFALVTEAQSYVRPSKGVSFSPLSQTQLDGGYFLATPTAGVTNIIGPIYDWSAFEAARVRIFTQTSGINPLDGGLHANDQNGSGYDCAGQSVQFTVTDLGSFVRFQIRKVGTQGWFFRTLDAPTFSGASYITTVSPNNFYPLNGGGSTNNFELCWVVIQITPIPFAPPNVTGSIAVILADGGFVTTSSKPSCTVSKNWAFNDGGTVVFNVPLDGGLANRWYIRTCNKANNSGTPTMTCTMDGQTPTTAAGSAGDALEVGDCATYYTTNTIQCIVDTNGTSISTEECQ